MKVYKSLHVKQSIYLQTEGHVSKLSNKKKAYLPHCVHWCRDSSDGLSDTLSS